MLALIGNLLYLVGQFNPLTRYRVLCSWGHLEILLQKHQMQSCSVASRFPIKMSALAEQAPARHPARRPLNSDSCHWRSDKSTGSNGHAALGDDWLLSGGESEVRTVPCVPLLPFESVEVQ